MKNLAFHSLIRWEIIVPAILATSLIHFSLKGWENVLCELGSENFEREMIQSTDLSNSTVWFFFVFPLRWSHSWLQTITSFPLRRPANDFTSPVSNTTPSSGTAIGMLHIGESWWRMSLLLVPIRGYMVQYVIGPMLVSTLMCHAPSRLTFPDPPPSGTELLKMGSKFRYSDRTLHQLRKEGFNVKEQPRFSRVSSRNWSHRYNMHPVTEHRVTVDDAERPNRQAPTKPPRRPVSGVMPALKRTRWLRRRGGRRTGVSTECWWG